LKINCY